MRAVLLLAGLLVGPVWAGEPPAEPILKIEAGVHTAVVNKVAATRDGRILTVSDDKTARLWTPGAGAPSTVLRVPLAPGSEGALYAVAVSPVKDSAVVAGRTGVDWDGAGAVYAFDLGSGRLTGRVGGLPGTVHALAYSRDGKFLAVGTGGRATLRVLDLGAKTVAAEDTAYGDTVVAAEFLADGRLATASLDGKVRLYGLGFTVSATYTLPEKRRPWRLAVSPAGDRIAVGSLDAGVVTLLSSDALRPVGELRGGAGRAGALSAVAWGPTALCAAGTYGDAQGRKFLRVWPMGKEPARESEIAIDTVTDLGLAADQRIAFTTAEPSVGLLEPGTLKVEAWRRSFADFRDAFEGTFAIARDGSAVDFGIDQKGSGAFRFDLNDRTLTEDPKARPGLARPLIPPSVRGWRNERSPTVQGTPVTLDENEYARSAAASADGHAVLLGADYSLRLLRDGRAVWTLPVHAPAWAVNLTGDGRLALAALGDGTLRWYRADDGAEVLALFATRDGRWIAWTPEGYFDHAPGAEDLVGYHLNHGRAGTPEFVRSGQIHRTFFRPDLVGLKARGDDLAPEVARTGDAKTVLSRRVPPTVQLSAWCVRGQCTEVGSVDAAAGGARQVTVDDAEVTLRVAVEDRGSGAGRVVMKRNAAIVPTRSVPLPAKGPVRTEEHTVVLEPGDNLITVSAYDGDQAVEAGAPVQLVVRYAAAAETAPTLHVLSVGVNRYRSRELNELVNAVSDARGVATLMSQVRQGLFKEARLTVLVEQDATLGNIQRAFQTVATSARPQDVVLVFLAGHGVIQDGQYYFLPYDVAGLTADALRSTALTQSALADMVSALPTSRTAILIDTCHAGAFATPDAILRQSRDRTWVGSLGFNTGRFVLAGTTNQQEALDGVAGHGVFTAVVLDGLRGQADQQGKGNRDGRVDVVELTRYAEARVPEEAHQIAPTHAQRAVGFFAGGDFFELSAAAGGQVP